MTKVQSLSEGGRELECGDLVHALKECLAAMESMRTQIEQMRGLFDDADGAIAGACRDHEAADAFARSVLEAEGGNHGKRCALSSTQGAHEMRWYDQTDFERNPGKYRLFKTARISEAPLAEDGYHVGRMVGIEYVDTRTNAAVAGHPDMPVYAVDGKFYLFARALADFTRNDRSPSGQPSR